MDTLLLFHWVDCGACKDYIPKFDEIMAEHTNIPFVKIELSATLEKGNGGEKLSQNELNEIIQWKETVHGYPTLAKWDGKKVIEFNGNRDNADELKQFVTKSPTVGGKRRHYTEKNGYKGYNYTANRGTRGLNIVKRVTAKGRRRKHRKHRKATKKS